MRINLVFRFHSIQFNDRKCTAIHWNRRSSKSFNLRRERWKNKRTKNTERTTTPKRCDHKFWMAFCYTINHSFLSLYHVNVLHISSGNRGNPVLFSVAFVVGSCFNWERTSTVAVLNIDALIILAYHHYSWNESFILFAHDRYGYSGMSLRGARIIKRVAHMWLIIKHIPFSHSLFCLCFYLCRRRWNKSDYVQRWNQSSNRNYLTIRRTPW